MYTEIEMYAEAEIDLDLLLCKVGIEFNYYPGESPCHYASGHSNPGEISNVDLVSVKVLQTTSSREVHDRQWWVDRGAIEELDRKAYAICLEATWGSDDWLARVLCRIGREALEP